MSKVAAADAVCKIVDLAIQLFGGGGTSNDHFLTAAYANARLLRLADGPDEVHRNQIARLEMQRHQQSDPGRTGGTADVLRSEEHTSELQSLMRISYAVFCLKKKKQQPSNLLR